jgi:Leucine-rich repeat (LRR) protein
MYKFTDSILQMYPDLERLELHSSPNITSVNHLSSLKELWLSDDCKSILSNDGIKGCLQLEELYLNGNKNITSLNHLKNLKIIDIEDTKITDEGIEGCTKLMLIWTNAYRPQLSNKYSHLIDVMA